MIRRDILAFVSLPLVAIPAFAAADDASPAVPAEVTGAVFPTMGADGAATQLGAQVLMLNVEEADSPFTRIDLTGQYVNEQGLGGYAAIGASTIEDVAVLGALEVGALFRREAGNRAVTVRAGLVLPTGTADDLGELLTGLISTAYSRPSDYLTALPDTTSLRMAFSSSFTRGPLIARADAGIDVTLDGEEPGGAFVHADVGAGVQGKRGAALVEMSTVTYLEDSEELLHVVAVTGELHAGKTTPYLTLSRPFQTGGKADSSDTVLMFGPEAVNVGVGLRGQI